MWNVVAFLILLTAGSAYAAVRGGAPERRMATIFVYGVVASKLAIAGRGRAFVQPEIALIAVDASMIGLAGWIALTAARIWPIAVVSALLAGVELQIGVLLAPARYHQVYRICHAISGYLVLLLLMGGTWRHARRQRQQPDPDWTAQP